MMNRILAFALLAAPALVRAQASVLDDERPAVLFPGAGHFFAAIVAGVVLAIAFQLLLTNLSIAGGLNALGAATDPDEHDRHGHDTRAHAGDDDENEHDHPVHDTVRNISHAFGAWTLVTASIALFFASWLAVMLSMTVSWVFGAVLGLTIWGLFYVTMMSVEASAFTSLVGALVRTAGFGLRSAWDATSSMLSKSTEKRAADTAAEIARSVREELFEDFDVDDAKSEIRRYVEKLQPKRTDPAEIRKEIEKLLDESEIRAVMREGSPAFDMDTFVVSLEKEGGMSRERARELAQSVKDAFSDARDEARTPKSAVEKVADASMRVAGVSSEEAADVRRRVEQYLRNTGKEALNPDGIKHDIEQLFSDPKGGIEALKTRLAHVDKETITAVLSQREDMTEEEARQTVERIDQAFRKIVGGGESGSASVRETVTENVRGVRERATGKVRDYLNGLNRPELRWEGISHDFALVFRDPKAGGQAIRRRLKAVDRDTLKAIVASRKDISDEEAEHIVRQMEQTRDDLVDRAKRMQAEIERRLEEARREAIRQADETRKTAATAAWWAFGTALVSGVAAALGGIAAAAGAV